MSSARIHTFLLILTGLSMFGYAFVFYQCEPHHCMYHSLLEHRNTGEVLREQPSRWWPCFDVDIHSATTDKKCHKLFLEVPSPGRLGNHIYGFAAMIGLAHRYNATPVLSTKSPIAKFFNTSISTIPMPASTEVETTWFFFKEKKPVKFDHRIKEMTLSKDAYFKGFFQSWRYFEDPRVQSIIHQHLRFNDYILKQAEKFISDTTKRHSNGQKAVKLIGVHIRRGDKQKNYKYGDTLASVDYVMKAMDYFRQKYPSNNVIFIFCTDTPSWVKSEIMSVNSSSSELSEGKSAEVDLAILSLCSDTIMSIGTFGWWGGWLANGETIYYGSYPRPGSMLADLFDVSDHYPPHWKPLE